MTEKIEFGGLSCSLNLPLEWSSLKDSSNSLPPSVVHANQNCLKIVLGLDDGLHDSFDENAELSQDLQRMDFKINIILEMLGQLVSQNIKMPINTDIKLGPKAIQWLELSSPPESGQSIQTKIFLDARFPFPFVIYGSVTSVIPVETGYSVVMKTAQENACSLELLEKYIFRCHRRQIARMKSETIT